MSTDYAKSVLDDIYAEGDRDCIFLEQLIGLIKYDELDQDRGRSFDEIVQGVLSLCSFLLQNGFFLDAMGSLKDEKSEKTGIVNPIVAIERYVRNALNSSDDFNQYAIALEKKKGALLPSEFPLNVLTLLS